MNALTPHSHGHGELVLIVDDNDQIRETIRTALVGHGYRTLATHDGATAISDHGDRAKEISLVITDLDMPRLDGRGLARAIRALHPAIKILFISGAGSDERLRHAADVTTAEFLAKPFRLGTLLEKVRAILDASA